MHSSGRCSWVITMTSAAPGGSDMLNYSVWAPSSGCHLSPHASTCFQFSPFHKNCFDGKPSFHLILLKFNSLLFPPQLGWHFVMATLDNGFLPPIHILNLLPPQQSSHEGETALEHFSMLLSAWIFQGLLLLATVHADLRYTPACIFLRWHDFESLAVFAAC